MRRQLQAGSARNALLWGVLVFGMLQLSMALSTEIWRPELRDPHFVIKLNRLRDRLQRAGVQPGRTAASDPYRPYVVVMLGSSHVTDGLRGAVIEPELGQRLGRPVILYNLAVRGDGPLNEVLNLERMLAAGIRPDLLLVEVLPAYLSKQGEIHFDLIAAERMSLSDLSLLRHLHLPVERLKRRSWRCWGLPWYIHRLEILTRFVPDLLPRNLRQDESRHCDDSGWQEHGYDESREGRTRATGYAWACYHGILSHYSLGNSFCSMLRVLLDRCHAEGIPTALVRMPESPSFRSYYAANAEAQINVFLKELTAAHGNPIINAQAWVDDELAFIDGHHLLPRGAARFSKRLGREAVLPLLRNLPRP
jgi:hypothetical protein